MKRVLPIFFSLLCSLSLYSQDYSLAVAGRIGSEWGVSVKQVFDSSLGTEAILAHYKDGIFLFGLAEYHVELGSRSGASLFFGAGGHAGYRDLFDQERAILPMAGIDAILGVDYALGRSSWVISVDVKPQLELLREIAPSGNHAGLSLRYIIN